MAFLNVSRVLRSPKFTDSITILRRTRSVNAYGEMSLTNEEFVDDAVVEGLNRNDLNLLPDSARLSNGIAVFYNGVLNLETETTYADVVVWNNKQYQVTQITEEWQNWGEGWLRALCIQVDAYA